jgi:hypothetical protein
MDMSCQSVIPAASHEAAWLLIKALLCFDRLSTSGTINDFKKNTVRPEPVEGLLAL